MSATTTRTGDDATRAKQRNGSVLPNGHLVANDMQADQADAIVTPGTSLGLGRRA
jgi:hypothetical protein